MTTAVSSDDRSGDWILLGIATCATCGALLTARTGGRSRRFYTCPCRQLREAAPLEDAVVTAVADRHWRAGLGNDLRPYLIRHLWRTATATERRSRVRRLVALVAVDPEGKPSVLWHIGPIEKLIPAFASATGDSRMAEFRIPHEPQAQEPQTPVPRPARPRVSGFREPDQPLPSREFDMLFAGLLANHTDWFATCRWCLHPIAREPGRVWTHVYTGNQICKLALPGARSFCDANPLIHDGGSATVGGVVRALLAHLDLVATSGAGDTDSSSTELAPRFEHVLTRTCSAAPPTSPIRPSFDLGARGVLDRVRAWLRSAIPRPPRTSARVVPPVGDSGQ